MAAVSVPGGAAAVGLRREGCQRPNAALPDGGAVGGHPLRPSLSVPCLQISAKGGPCFL